jgi:hypothetical protein
MESRMVVVVAVVVVAVVVVAGAGADVAEILGACFHPFHTHTGQS